MNWRGLLVYLPVVAALCAYATYYLWPTIFRTWYFNSDEYVFGAEVIRFVHFDFRQQFFDTPGTPFIFLCSGVWVLIYSVQFLLGMLPSGTSLEQFTFSHMSELFATMRGVVVICFVISICLVYLVVTKLTNHVGALIASLLLILSPIYTSYSSFVRTESLALCFELVAILLLLCGLDRIEQAPAEQRNPTGWTVWWPLAASGVAAGIGAGARLHASVAYIPLLLMIVLAKRWRSGGSAQPAWVRRFWPWAFSASFILGGVLLAHVKTQPFWDPYPHAVALIVKASAAMMLAGPVLLVLSGIRRGRALTSHIMDPAIAMLLIGLCLGLLIALPTVITQYKYFIDSMEMYSGTYIDHDREKLPLISNAVWLLKFYLGQLAPDWIARALLALGALWIILERNWRLLPFVAGGLLFFVSKPLNLNASAHHVIPWMPMYALISGYPLARAYEFLTQRFRMGRLWEAALGGLAVLIFFGLTSGPKLAGGNALLHEERLRNVQNATDWMKSNLEPDATVAIAYYCFNPDVFFQWLRYLEVPAPPYVFDGRKYLIWWGYQSALKGQKGYACATEYDAPNMKERLELSAPGDGTDPFKDSRFSIVRKFGSGKNAVYLFKFNFQ